MQVILKETVKNLGKVGEVVSVKDGYGRNYLLPRGIAIDATSKNIRTLEHQKRMVLEKARKISTDAQTIASRLAEVSITIKAKAGEEEKLFGSVTAIDIAEALKAHGFEIDKRKIVLDEPIKRLGSHKVTVKIHSDINAELTVNVEPED